MAQKRGYIRQGSLDRHPRDWWQRKESVPDCFDHSAPIKPIPVFHERSGFPDSRLRTTGANTIQNSYVDAEDILFNKRSGVTRIPAARVRRHSIQIGQSGSYYNPDSRGEFSGYQNRVFGNEQKRRIWNSADEFPDQKTRTLQGVGRSGDAIALNKGEPTEQRHHTSLDPGGYSGGTTSGKLFRQVPVSVDDRRTVRDCVPIDLTPVQSDTSSHIICHKPSGYGRSRTTEDSHPYEMGVVTVDQSRPLAAGDGAKDDGATYRRQLSSSNVTLSNDGRSAPSDVTPTYVKRNIHVRRHSVSAPSALRLAPKPKLLQDFQDWTSNAPAAGSPSCAKSPEVTSNECGMLVPVRRYSVTYAPKSERSQSEGGASNDETAYESGQVAPAVEKVKNRKKSARRRCRPLSIVSEGTLSTEVDGEEFDSGVVTDESVNDLTTTTTAAYDKGNRTAVAAAAAAAAVAASPAPTAVSIEREDGNVNIVAAGDVNICLGTDKPFSVIDRSGSYDASRLDPLARGPAVLERSAGAGDGHSPVGMWRQGNVLVDSVGPAQQGPMYQLPYGAQQLPMVQPIPMIYHPYLNPELRGGFGYQGGSGSAGQKKSIYSPLSVDTSEQQAQPTFLPFPVPRPVFRFTPTPSGGLLRTAASRRGIANANKATPSGYPDGKAKNREDETTSTGSHRSVTESRPMGVDVSGHVTVDVVNRADDESPPPQIDVKEMISDFESKLDTKATVPEFGTAFGDVKGSSSRRASKDLQAPADGKYRLQVEGDDRWQVTQSPTEAEPTTLRAYIAEMSISERKYQDNQTVTSP